MDSLHRSTRYSTVSSFNNAQDQDREKGLGPRLFSTVLANNGQRKHYL